MVFGVKGFIQPLSQCLGLQDQDICVWTSPRCTSVMCCAGIYLQGLSMRVLLTVRLHLVSCQCPGTSDALATSQIKCASCRLAMQSTASRHRSHKRKNAFIADMQHTVHTQPAQDRHQVIVSAATVAACSAICLNKQWQLLCKELAATRPCCHGGSAAGISCLCCENC